MKKRALLLLAASVFLAGCGRETSAVANGQSGDENAAWLTNFDKAKAEAAAGHRMLLINFTGSDWCPPCILLHRQILDTPEFIAYAKKNLVLLEVDFPRTKERAAAQKEANAKLAEQYGISGFPTEIVLDPTGRKLGELGYMRGGPQAFLAALEKLRPAQ